MARCGRDGVRLLLNIAVLLVFATQVRAVDKFCVLDTKVQAGGVVSLKGDVIVPVPAKLQTTTDVPLYGDIAIVFPTDKCPVPSELAAALADAFLAEPTGSKSGVHIDRLAGTAEMDGLVLGTIAIQDQQGHVFSTAPIGKDGALQFELRCVAGKGVVESDIVAVAPMELSKGTPLPGKNCFVRTSAIGDVTIDCSKLELDGHIETPEASADIQISGNFQAVGNVAAGRLVDAALFPGAPVAKPQLNKVDATPEAAVIGGSTPAATPAADCSGDNCDGKGAAASAPQAAAASQKAQTQSGVAAAAAVPSATAQTAQAGASEPSSLTGAPGPRCSAGGGSSCTCEEGWAGNNCVRCTAPAVCPAFTGQLLSSCDTAMEYTSRTAYKGYSCSVKGGFGALVKNITGVCNVRGTKLPFGDGPLGLQPGAVFSGASRGEASCKLVATLSQDSQNPLECVGSSCTFAEGSASFSCARARCGCPAKGSCIPIVQSILNNMKNSSVGIDCKSSGECTLAGIQPRLDLHCDAGECTQPEVPPARLPSLDAPPAKPFPTVAMVACIAPIVLSILGFLGLAYVAVSRRLFSSGNSGRRGDDQGVGRRSIALAEQNGPCGGGRVRLLPHEVMGHPVRFEFTGIYCAVPDRGAADAPAAAAAAGKSFSGLSEVGDLQTSLERPSTPLGGLDGVAEGGRRQQKLLLHGVSGAVSQGEVVGVMGPSGAGKSTLLSILSGATESVGAGARVEGSVTLGGEARRSVLRKVTAFVPQKDVLLPALTVEECVRYSALLRLPRSLGAEEIQERIDGVLAELGLSHVATSLVGGSASIRGVSGGERRRVTIAMALVTRPRLVIMDEPTSGLDSYTAYNLMRTAQDIAKHGRVVIMSLHQPSPDMFDSLSQVLLLAKGRLAYLGTPAGVGPSFAAAGYPCPPGRQPAEHMLHVASQPAGLAALLRRVAGPAHVNLSYTSAKTKLSELRIPSFSAKGSLAKGCGSPRTKALQVLMSSKCEGGASSSTSADDEWQIASAAIVETRSAGPAAAALSCDAVEALGARQELMLQLPPQHSHQHLHGGQHHAPPPATPVPEHSRRFSGVANWAGGLLRECSVLYWRAFTNMRREPRLLMLHLLVALILGLIVGAVFFKLDTSNVGLQNRLGAMFFALALFGWTSVSVVDGLVLERELVEREVAGHYYSGSTYLLSSLVLDGLLLRTLPALLFSALVYPMIGLLPEVSRVVTFMFVLATYTCTVGALTTALTALCRTSSATTLAMNIILLMWVLIGGYLVNPNSIPGWLRWVRSLSPLSFAFEVLAANEMADQFFSIHVDGLPSIGGIKGDVFLRTLGLDPSRTLVSAASLAGFYGGAVALAFAAMSYTLWKHGGGTWTGALCGGRDSAPHTASAFNGGGDNGVGGVNSSARAAAEPRALCNEGVAAPARLDTAMSPRLVE